MVVLSSCVKKEECPTFFQLPLTVYPEQEEYKVNDTLRFVSKFHKEAAEVFNSNQDVLGKFDMGGIRWKPNSYIRKLDTVEACSHFLNYFSFIKTEVINYLPSIFSHATVLSGEYTYANDTFYLEYKLVALEPGLYVHDMHSSLSTYLNVQEYPGMCNKKNGFSVFFKMNDGMDNNIELLHESPDPYWNDWVLQKPKDRFHRKAGYCFRVVK